jgi:hypothetical protein
MLFRNVQNQAEIYKRWQPLIDCQGDITDESVKMSTAIVLENVQSQIDEQAQIRNSRGLLTEAAGITTGGAMGPYGDGPSLAATAADGSKGDARVPSVVIPMIRRIFPQLIAHKLVGVQPMQGPIGMAFAFRARYGKNSSGGMHSNYAGEEIGYLGVHADHTGSAQSAGKFGAGFEDQVQVGVDRDGNPIMGRRNDQGQIDLGGLAGNIAKDPQGNEGGVSGIVADPTAADFMSCFYGPMNNKLMYGNTFRTIGDGAETADAENWAVGSTMPEAGFEILKATVTAKTRKLGVQITRETEEDMKAMQGLNAQNEVSDIISYEIAQEIDRQLLGEITQAAVRMGNAMMWSPAVADGRNQTDRINGLYTTILTKSNQIATQSRRGAANWAVCSPAAAALLESHIYDPLGMAGGLGNAKAFGGSIDNGVGVTEIGTLRNGTIKLYRDTLAGGDYILLGFKGQGVYDAGIIYLPYIPLELMHAVDPFTMNPVTAARTRYGITTNLFGAGQFYQFIGLPDLTTASLDGSVAKKFMQF